MKKNRLLAPLACMLFATQTGAQETEPQQRIVLDEIVIDALRSDTAIGTVPGSIEVIQGEEIRQKAGGDVKKYLTRRVAGLQPSNGTISSASETMRGRNVQVLVNGVPRVSDLRGFSRELSLIDPESIERIEIVKGATALYGNGATGGLINIVTKTAKEDGVHGGGGVLFSAQDQDFSDSFATQVNVFGSMRQGGLGLRLDVGGEFSNDRYDGHGDKMPSDPLVGQGGGDNLETYNISGAVTYEAGSHEFALRGQGVKLLQKPDYYSDYTTDPVSVDSGNRYDGRDARDKTWSISGDYRNRDLMIGDLSLTGFYSDSKRRAAYVPAGPANPLFYYSGNPFDPQDRAGQSVLDTSQYGFRGVLSNKISIATLTTGVDYQHDKVHQRMLDGRDIIAPMKQESLAGFAQLDVPITKWFDLRGGFRYEKFWLDVGDFNRPTVVQLDPRAAPAPGFVLPALDVTGGKFTYDAWVFNIGGVAHLTDELDLFAGFSQGYSIPDVGSFTRRAVNANPFDPSPISYGSIDPSASKVDNYEGGVRYFGKYAAVSAAGFYATSKHGTTFDPATNAVSQQKERTWGAELNAEIWPTNELTLGTVLGYQEGKYDSDGDGDIDDYLPNNRIASPFTATIYAGYQITPEFNLGGDIRFTANRHRDPAYDIRSTFTLNLNARYDIGGGTLVAGIDNVTDDYNLNPSATSVRNIPIAAEGRRFWLGYNIQF